MRHDRFRRSYEVIPVIDLMGGWWCMPSFGDRAHYRPIRSRLCDSARIEDVGRRCSPVRIPRLYVADLDALQGRPWQLSTIDALRTGGGTEAAAVDRRRDPRRPGPFPGRRARHASARLRNPDGSRCERLLAAARRQCCRSTIGARSARRAEVARAAAALAQFAQFGSGVTARLLGWHDLRSPPPTS